MKKFMSKLKGQGFKQLAIDHGEKAVCGLIGLLVLFLLVGANWSTYQKKPREFTEQIANGRKALQASTWPDDERKKFMALENIDRTVEISAFASLPSEAYELPTEVRMPLKPKVELMKEPTLLALRGPQAKSDVLIMFVNPITDEIEDPMNPDEPSSDDESTKPKSSLVERFGPKPGQKKGTATASGAPLLGGTGAEVPDMVDDAMDPEAMANMLDEDVDGADSESVAGSGSDGRGYRYVAVTGIVPVREQAEEFMKKLNIRRLSEARQQLVYKDFVVERQTATRGDDPWSGPWEKLDLAATLDVFKQAAGHDQDIVPENVRNSVLTAPLPTRVGNWLDKIVSHPMIKTLTDKQREEERLLNEKTMKAYRDKFGDPDQPRQFGGYDQLVYDINGMRQQVLSTDAADEVMNDVTREMRMMGDSSGGAADPAYGDADAALFQRRIAQDAQVLLFRFLDFEVEPGKTYRYRVKLVLQNPTFEKALDQVSHEGMTLQDKIQTPWSDPTPPVTVAQDTKFYLSSVKTRRITDETTANFDLFYWLADAGTTVNVHLDTAPGQFIGRATDAEVIRPARKTFEREEDVPLSTDDMLVDVASAPVIVQSDHLDLDFQRASGVSRARGSAGIGAADRALVIDPNGELVVRDTAQDASPHRQAMDSYKEFAEFFADLKPVEKEEGADDLDAFMDDYDDEMMGPESGRIKSVTKRGRSRGRGRSRSRNSGSSAGGGDSPTSSAGDS